MPLEKRMNKPLALFWTWLFPGLGHFLLGSRRRAFLYAGVILVCLFSGMAMQGRLYGPQQGDLISWLASAANAGLGVLYFILKLGFQYSGDPHHALSEYGTIFILSAGLMNGLLLLEVEKLWKERNP
jgi:TM2 domain-containing membrane protein YozV